MLFGINTLGRPSYATMVKIATAPTAAAAVADNGAAVVEAQVATAADPVTSSFTSKSTGPDGTLTIV
jgi:hypothetical protein